MFYGIKSENNVCHFMCLFVVSCDSRKWWRAKVSSAAVIESFRHFALRRFIPPFIFLSVSQETTSVHNSQAWFHLRLIKLSLTQNNICCQAFIELCQQREKTEEDVKAPEEQIDVYSDDAQCFSQIFKLFPPLTCRYWTDIFIILTDKLLKLNHWLASLPQTESNLF